MSSAVMISKQHEKLLCSARPRPLQRFLGSIGLTHVDWTMQPSNISKRRYPGRGHVLAFNMREAIALAIHAVTADEHRPADDQLFDRSLWIDRDAVLTREDMALDENAHIDTRRVTAALELVSDNGVYLMSNGIPVQRSLKRRNECQSVFARGHNPYRDNGWQTLTRQLLGTSKVSTVIPLSWITNAYERGDSTFKILITANGLQAHV